MVAMGFTQVEGVDYNETFASVMVTKSFRILLAIWNLRAEHEMEHWDIKQAFINAPLDEVIYCRPVQGFEKRPGEILKLRKALYGTKQAAHAWQKFLKKNLLALGAKVHPKDDCVFIFRDDRGGWLFLSTHVDDLFPSGKHLRDRVYEALGRVVEVEDRGLLSWALSTKIERDAQRGCSKFHRKRTLCRS